MYKIKQSPEDFVVEEVTNIEPKDSGPYSYYWMKKKEYTTSKAVEIIARKLKLKLRQVGYAGAKDKKAITLQLISLKNIKKERVESLDIKDIELKFHGYGDTPISLGNLIGNKFRIVVDTDNPVNVEHIKIPNYFGEQRFSTNNPKIGKYIVKKQFKQAALLIQGEPRLTRHLEEHPGDYIGALRQIPRRILLLYVHSYQSLLWNLTVERMIEKGIEQEKIAIIGFGTEESDINEIMKTIMDNEELTFRDFIIKQIPAISAEGDLRNMFIDTSITVSNYNNTKQILEFQLPKGSYATTVVKELYS
ncbi:MAG: tRNA pseudouridine(13) synthase TruD [Nanoarchaeota archaeon]|nr:tRNA pseudouridine(13) synthase TruD [Nanoarchaeota archaeon]